MDYSNTCIIRDTILDIDLLLIIATIIIIIIMTITYFQSEVN